MSDYHIDYRWHRDHAIPVLHVTIAGALPTIGHSLPAIINRAHARIDQCADCHAVHLVYDISGTSGRLPLAALMRRDQPSRKVERAAIVGARTRADEMAVLIMAAACRLPYDFEFFDSPAAAAAYLRATEPACNG